MSGNYFGSAGIFLVQTLIGLYAGAVLLRVMLQAVRADFYHPVCQFILRITNPLVIPLRKIVPPWRRIDLASVVLAYLLCVMEYLILSLIAGASINLLAALVFGLATLINLIIYIYIILIVVQAVLSWVSPYGENPIAPLIYPLTRPVLGLFQRIIPPLGGLDISPLFALLALNLARFLVVMPIMDLVVVIAQS